MSESDVTEAPCPYKGCLTTKPGLRMSQELRREYMQSAKDCLEIAEEMKRQGWVDAQAAAIHAAHLLKTAGERHMGPVTPEMIRKGQEMLAQIERDEAKDQPAE